MSNERGLPVIRTDSPDNAWEPLDAMVRSDGEFPDGEFLAIAVVPCPAGRVARGGVGGQVITACACCGHPSASSAMERHEGPMLVPVIARKEVDIVTFRRATEADLTGRDEQS